MKLLSGARLALLTVALTACRCPAEPADADPQALAERIDRHFAARWEKANVRPADLADDAEFQRRVTLDLIGRIPTVAEARAFQRETAPDRRRRLIDQLLNHPGYAVRFARLWGEQWMPQGDAQFENLKPQFLDWLRERLARERPI